MHQVPTPVDFRNDYYYNLYDYHIRCWVPEYDRFISSTASKIVERLGEKANSGSFKGAILEVGCGTGALSAAVLEAILTGSDVTCSLCQELVAIDKASEMIDRTRQRTESTKGEMRITIEQGTAFDGLSPIVREKAPFDVIFGSLVLSHILQDNVEKNLKKALARCRMLLTEGGAVVFSDAIIAEPRARERSRQYWREWMLRNGLGPEKVERFLDNNQEMLETVSLDQLTEIGAAHGFEVNEVDLVPGATEESPFRIVVLTRVD